MDKRDHILRYFKKTHDWVEKEGNAKLKEEGLTLAQGHILGILRHTDGYCATFKEMEKKMRVAQSTTVGMVTRLEHNGFVKTSIDPEDKRIKIVTLTQKGIEVTEKVKESIRQIESDLLKELTSEEKTILVDLLSKITDQCD